MDKVETYSLRLQTLTERGGFQMVFEVEKAINLMEFFGFRHDDLKKAVVNRKRQFHNGRFDYAEEAGA